MLQFRVAILPMFAAPPPQGGTPTIGCATFYPTTGAPRALTILSVAFCFLDLIKELFRKCFLFCYFGKTTPLHQIPYNQTNVV